MSRSPPGFSSSGQFPAAASGTRALGSETMGEGRELASTLRPHGLVCPALLAKAWLLGGFSFSLNLLIICDPKSGPHCRGHHANRSLGAGNSLKISSTPWQGTRDQQAQGQELHSSSSGLLVTLEKGLPFLGLESPHPHSALEGADQEPAVQVPSHARLRPTASVTVTAQSHGS